MCAILAYLHEYVDIVLSTCKDFFSAYTSFQWHISERCLILALLFIQYNFWQQERWFIWLSILPGTFAICRFAEYHISIFVISTFSTDYVLMKAVTLAQAREVLQASEHQVIFGGM